MLLHSYSSKSFYMSVRVPSFCKHFSLDQERTFISRQVCQGVQHRPPSFIPYVVQWHLSNIQPQLCSVKGQFVKGVQCVVVLTCQRRSRVNVRLLHSPMQRLRSHIRNTEWRLMKNSVHGDCFSWQNIHKIVQTFIAILMQDEWKMRWAEMIENSMFHLYLKMKQE